MRYSATEVTKRTIVSSIMKTAPQVGSCFFNSLLRAFVAISKKFSYAKIRSLPLWELADGCASGQHTG